MALVGDLTLDVQLLDRGHVPEVSNRRLPRRSTAVINQLRQGNLGLVMLATYDPGAAKALAKAQTVRDP